MSVHDILIADAVVSLLSDASDELPNGTIVERRLLPIYRPSDLVVARVAVAPRMQSRTLASRSSSKREHVVQIAPHKNAAMVDGQPSEADLAEFVGLMNAIGDAIERAAKAGTIGGATLISMTTEPLYDIEAAKSMNVLRGVWTVMFSRLAKA